jgi:regulator of protease activity HflC (stomatin/prohibitin superfamily)
LLKKYKRGVRVLSFYSAIIIFLLFMIFKTIIIVSERENVIIERLGKYQRTLTPGIYFLIPFFDAVAYKQEMREQVVDIPSQGVITKDNIQVEVDGLLYLKVMDPKKASYGIGNYLAATNNLAQTTMRSEVGKITLGAIFSEREEVNAKIISEIDKASDPWGVKVLRYEIKDISPSRHVVETLEKQMEAEREKRAEITRATAEKEKLINVSEGKRQQAINISEGEKQKRINEAKGKAEGIKLIADSTARSLALVGESISLDGGDEALKMRLVDQYIDQVDEVLSGGDVSLFPTNLASLKGIVDELVGSKSGLKGSDHVIR